MLPSKATGGTAPLHAFGGGSIKVICASLWTLLVNMIEATGVHLVNPSWFLLAVYEQLVLYAQQLNNHEPIYAT